MPELPEIETVKLQLEKVLVGEIIKDIEIRRDKIFSGNKDRLVGKKILGVRRRAKVLLLDFDDQLSLAVHFKMSGQLIYDEYKLQDTNSKKKLISKVQIQNIQTRVVGGHPTKDFVGSLPSGHTRVIFYLGGGVLYFNDQRMFGWVKIADQLLLQQMFNNFGPEPWDMTENDFVNKLKRTKKPIKVAIMDQSVISGVGNIYANDALWEAGINPQVPSHKLESERVMVLLEKIILVLNEGIKYGGATMADSKYVDLRGLGGGYQNYFRTYAREGEPCKRCGEMIIKAVLGGRGTYWCPKCQI